jgi:hypothetical protein
MKKSKEKPIYDTDKGVVYFEKFPDWVRDKYHQTIGGKCQMCSKEISKYQMEIHRVKRGNEGGKYTLCKLNHPKQNCKFLCKDCHSALHANEFNHVSHRY